MKKKQIFFLHFAGGNCYSFNFLLPLLTAFEIHQLELPGRGKRMTEAPIDSKDSAVQDYLKQIKAKLNGAPFMICGHSMGAYLGIYVIEALEKEGIVPVKFLATGNSGPGCYDDKKRYLLDKPEFLAELEEIGGMPADFFDHPELLDYFLPILRADFRIIEHEVETQPMPGIVQTPIIALMGSDEEKIEEIVNWKKYTSGSFQSLILKGNHFFIHEHADSIGQLIRNSF